MKQISEATTELILDAAKKEFLEYGFTDASLRRISSQCGVSTHTVYTRFGDKEGLFDALVRTAAEGLFDEIRRISEATVLSGTDSLNMIVDSGQGNMDFVVDYIFKERDLFRLIFCRSDGTKYADYIKRLSKMEADNYKRILSQSEGLQIDADDFFIETVCASNYLYLKEALRHELSCGEAKTFMSRVTRYNMAGWMGLIRE